MGTQYVPPRPAVVVLDDDPGILAALQRLLRDEPYEVLTTSNPVETLQWLASREVRVLVIDERMPHMTGSELLGWVRARFPELPTVILTGYASTALVVEQQHLRIERLVMKPWDDENLRELLHGLAGFGPEKTSSPVCRIDCDGKSEFEVLSSVLPELVLAKERGREVALELQRLDKLTGSLARLLLSLVRLASEQKVGIILRDGSGLADTALKAIGALSPFVTSGSPIIRSSRGIPAG